MRQAFSGHRSGAARRGIPFLFGFEEWRAWWLEDGRWEHRRPGGLCMARRGDAGPYAPNNVYCATHAQNTKDYYDRKCPIRLKEVVAFSAPEGTQARIDAL